ncbi:hypothetical protein BC832DRAFT_590421 [Gaertneriomyces semiglobifer]|nr:hypothetical protein BC832DRAFT_590421 [Gaertneriomyces semiglobifer]
MSWQEKLAARQGSRSSSVSGGPPPYSARGPSRPLDSQNVYDRPMHQQQSSYKPPSQQQSYGRSTHDPSPGNPWAGAAARAAEENGSTAYKSWETVDDEPEDYDNEEWLDRKTQKVQNDSLMSTRRALQRVMETEDVGRSNLEKLGMQGEQLYKVEGRLDVASSHVKVSDAKADHLKSLNRFFMLPSFGSKKAKKKEEAARREKAELEARDLEREEEDRARSRRLGRFEASDAQSYKSPHKGMYSTPDGIERDATEEELDNNLDQISSGLSRLKMMASTMGEELDSQTHQIKRIEGRAISTGETLDHTTGKINRILGK